ncbi:MAG: NAD(P)/FAD-dependent oxidoreductase [Rhodopila sp.]
MVPRVLVVGGGFAGLWAAAGAARTLDQFGASGAAEVVLVNPDPFHVIRVRCYEADLAPVRVALDAVLGPIGVCRVEGRATGIDRRRRMVPVQLTDGGAITDLSYDRLVLAAGSALARPSIPGLAEHAFDVDTYGGGERLARHLAALGAGSAGLGRWTAVVIGAGLVGLEIACELPARLQAAQQAAGVDQTAEPVRVVLLDHSPICGTGMGSAAAPAIQAALAAAGVAARGGVAVRAVDAGGVRLETGEYIAAQTTLCATGMRASALAAAVGVPLDALGRVPVDTFLQVEGGTDAIYAAGDVARAQADGAGHVTVMSCQHARPMGRIAGHNAACDLLGRAEARVAFAAPEYVTVLDLGPWGAVYTADWDRSVVRAQGAAAKAVKREINGRRIYPPLNGDRRAILDAAAPVIQVAPALAPG